MLMEFHLQRRIEQHGFAFHLIKYVCSLSTSCDQYSATINSGLAQLPVRVRSTLYKTTPEYVDRIKTKTVALRLFHHPARPVLISSVTA